ncbi:aminotransferase class V-fold PLP-dependent enzyme [Streptomyces olivaceoviridis]|uniref:aminotransferase class V-fold PLP-dependent enzyme n=1 Tax=Streptomyces olivaceoviridis TaxID=1921 RepID=UPI00369D47CE
MSPEEFRALFPALASTVWLDTPGCPPGAAPVLDALRTALSDWATGDFDWLAWDAAADEARRLFAGLLGVEAETVTTLGSLSEAAATVAGSLPAGRIVLAAEEFRSNLFPWLARHDVVSVPQRNGTTHIADLIDAIDDDTVMLAISEVTTREGQRMDLPALRVATDRVGARLFVNLTQSLGALRFDYDAVRPDYLAVHGYKWMLCPRGAAWLVTEPRRVPGLTPLAPSWKSTPSPHGYFGGPPDFADTASRCDTSPAWFSWIGASASLRLLTKLDPARVEAHCLRLADRLLDEATALGYHRVAQGPRSHIVVLRAEHPRRTSEALAAHGIRATMLADRVRFGFHYFNNDADVDAAVAALHTGKKL